MPNNIKVVRKILVGKVKCPTYSKRDQRWNVYWDFPTTKQEFYGDELFLNSSSLENVSERGVY